MLTPFIGIRRDLKDRFTLQDYISDWKDALNYRVVPATLETFLNNLLPAIAFSQDLFNRTNHTYGLNEILLSQGVSGLLFGLFGYPLSIVGVSAPSCMICYTIFEIFMNKNGELNIPKDHFNDGFDFLGFMFWVYLWCGIITIVSSVFNMVSFFRVVTLFPCDIFGLFINVVYVVKGCELLGLSFSSNRTFEDVATGFANITIAICMTVFGILAKRITETRLFTHNGRIFIRDYSTVTSVIFWSGVIHFGNAFKFVSFEKLFISKSFDPTYIERTNWLAIDRHLPAKYVFLALPFGVILWILLFFDHNISSLMAQKADYKLKKKSVYHWDFCILSIHTIICGVLGIPAGHCLIPQSFLHSETLLVFDDCFKKTKEEDHLFLSESVDNSKTEDTHEDSQLVNRKFSGKQSDNTEAQCTNFEEPRDFKNVVITGVVEQRLTNSLQGLMMIICMCRPFLICLHQIPQCVLAALFFILGINGIVDNTNIRRLAYLLSDVKDGPLNQISNKKIIAFLCITFFFAAGEIIVSQLDKVAIGFPLVLLLSIIVTYFLPKIFTKTELNVMNANVVTSESIKNLLPENLQ
ncbi:hypothetical protein QEN19_002972 [Hanseniaspora menglaensis]